MVTTRRTPVTAPAPAVPARLTLGVEEEFLLLDPATGANVPVAAQVIAALPDDVRGQSRPELRPSMLEMVTPVCTELAGLHAALAGHRRMAAAAAATVGARLAAIAATPVGDPQHEPPAQPRYQEMVRRYGPVAADPPLCGGHIHVGVPDRDLAVRVCNRLRVWLPVVQAMTANSPLYAGADTGQASWRGVQLQRWPGLGPTPYFESAADYDATVADMVSSGVMLDDGMVNWYARPSNTYPTVEVRIGDVCLRARDTVLVAALVRALVATLIDDELAAVPVPRVRSCLVAAAHWRAAHEGLDGTLVDLRLGTSRPAWELVDELTATVSPALLRHGDVPTVVEHLTRLRREGTGSARQRRVLGRTGDVGAVLTDVARQTVAD